MTPFEASPTGVPFELKHAGLQAYMQSRDNTVSSLSYYVDLMGEDDHPFVRYAAGWAAAEVALYRIRPNGKGNSQIVLPYRQESLELAKSHWQAASKDMTSWANEQTTPELAYQARTIEIRLAQALAYIPLMEVAASWFAGKPLGRLALKRQHETRGQTARVAAMVSGLCEDDVLGPDGKASIAGEVLCGLVGQIIGPKKYTTLPSALRVGRYGRSKSDYMTVMAGWPYCRKPIRTSTQCLSPNGRYPQNVRAKCLNPEESIPPSTITVCTYHSFGLRSRQSLYETLDTFSTWQAHSASVEAEAIFEDMGLKLSKRLAP